MAEARQRIGDREPAPRVVLPATSRGIELTDRACWALLGAAMAASAALLLYLSRGTTFGIDELVWVYESPTLGPGDVLDPYNQALAVTTRILYKVVLEAVGADYLAFRLIWVGSALLSAGFLFAVVKRRIGAAPALAPAVLMLLFGSAITYFTGAIGFIAMFAVAAGLAALLALEREDTLGDVAACLLLTVSIATFSVGLGFVVGVTISILLLRGRLSRLWIVAVPGALYGAWWLSTVGATQSSVNEFHLSNILLVPSYVVDALAASLAAVTGLSYGFGPSALGGGGWGYVLAVLAVAALTVRIIRGKVPTSLWASLAIVLSVWILGGLVVSDLRPPDAPRYLYMGAIGVILVASAAATRVRFTKPVLVVLFAATAVSLATNLELLRQAAAAQREVYSAKARAGFTMLELAADEVPPTYVPPLPAFRLNPPAYGAARYLAAADRYGSFGLPLAELGTASLPVREFADRTLVGAKQLELAPTPDDAATGSCRDHTAAEASAGIELPSGGATLIAKDSSPASVNLGRFAPPSETVGRLRGDRPATLSIKPDADPQPWTITVPAAGSVQVCAL